MAVVRITYKICTKCGRILPVTNMFFSLHKQLKDGFDSKCKKCKGIGSRCYYKKNINKERTRGREKAKRDAEAISIYRTGWSKNNKAKIRNGYVSYRFRKRNQTPTLTQEEKKQIIDVYKQAVKLGSDWHVDHITPLIKGGLHHPDNLQIVVKKYNLEKGGKLNFRLPTNMEVYKWAV